MQYPTHAFRRRAGLATLLLAFACAKNEGRSSDSAAATRSDSSMAGMSHDSAGMASMGMQHDTATADHAFLRQMSNHHEGLVAMTTPVMDKATSASAKSDARKLHTEQKAEQDTMTAMVRSQYGESGFTPMIMPEHKAMTDSLQALSGQDYDRTFYRMTIQHHREGVAMIDSVMPTLKDEKVKQMASKMKETQQREIADFEKKASGS